MAQRLLPVAIGIVLAAMIGCINREDVPPTTDSAPKDELVPIEAPAEDLKVLAEGNNAFAFDLYKKLATETEGNIVVSPYSIRTALAMTYAGARGETAEEMRKVLHFTLPDDKLHAAFAATARQLQSTGEQPYELNIANALWGQKGYPFLPEFLDLNRRIYGGGLCEVDFVSDSGAARQKINQWAAEKTKDRIKELIGPEDLNSSTRLVLTNAIYLKATWSKPFLKGETKDAPFKVTPDSTIPVAMMQTQDAQFRYHADANCEWLRLPYLGGQLSMIVVVPENGRLHDVEKTLTAAAIETGIKKLKYHQGVVSLPRFQATETYVLAKQLKSMGMPSAFTGAADFSGMSGGQELQIGFVNHQAFLRVDENGSEAAAATSVGMFSSTFKPFSLTVDRPFLFFIRDGASGNILFMGRVNKPEPIPAG